MSAQEIRTLLKEANTARFCSLNPNGTIHAATVNYKYGKGRILFATPEASRKAKNTERNGNVTLLVDIAGTGLDAKGVIIYGNASVNEGTLPEMLSINETWMPADRVEVWTERMFGLTKWVTIRIEPERTASWDYTKDNEFAAVFQK